MYRDCLGRPIINRSNFAMEDQLQGSVWFPQNAVSTKTCIIIETFL